MQDTSRLYLGAYYSYRELLEHEMVPFKYKSIIDSSVQILQAASSLSDKSSSLALSEAFFPPKTGMSRKAIEDAIRISGDKIEAILSAADGGVR